MGQYYKIVNVSKKEFVDIGKLGEDNKASFLGQGLNGIVLGRLLMSGGSDWAQEVYDEMGYPDKDRFYLGAWAGDRIVIAGDYDDADTNGVKSSTEDDESRNLFQAASNDGGYVNVTYEVIEWLAKSEFTADLLVERAKKDKELLAVLSNLVFVKRQSQIEKSLVKILGDDWSKMLKE